MNKCDKLLRIGKEFMKDGVFMNLGQLAAVIPLLEHIEYGSTSQTMK
jgi:hypothetical protein